MWNTKELKDLNQKKKKIVIFSYCYFFFFIINVNTKEFDVTKLEFSQDKKKYK